MFNVRKRPFKTAEFAQLVDCCRSAFALPGETAEPPPLRAGLDWERFLGLARRHRVQGLVWRTLHQTLDAVPPPVAAALAQDARSIAREGMAQAVACAKIHETFSSSGVTVLFVKGLTLAKLAYGDPFFKMSGDIDILIDAEQLALAEEQLRKGGYELAIPRPRGGSGQLQNWHRGRKESVWRKPGQAFDLDLHTRLADNSRLLPQLTASSPRQLVAVAPGIELPTLADDELFAYLSVHGSGSAWFRLKWLADLAALLERIGRGRISHFYRRSQDLGAAGGAGPALLLANDLFATPLDPALAQELRDDFQCRWLTQLAWSAMTNPAEPTEERFGTGAIHLVQFLLRPGIGFKLGELRRQLADAAGNRA